MITDRKKKSDWIKDRDPLLCKKCGIRFATLGDLRDYAAYCKKLLPVRKITKGRV